MFPLFTCLCGSLRYGIADMAELVDSQASAITEIADKTEASHERAKAGLTQVQQAAGHQPGCSVC